MKVAYRKRFLKDLASVPSHLRPPVERFVFDELPRADSLQSTGKVSTTPTWPEALSVTVAVKTPLAA